MRPNMKYYIVFSLIIGVLTGLSITINMPSNMEYSVFNTGRNGYSVLYDFYHPVIISSYSDLRGNDGANHYLVLVSIRSPLKEYDATTLAAYAEKGNIIIINGEPEALNETLKNLGVDALVLNSTIYDPIENIGSKTYLVVYVWGIDNNESLVLCSPHPIISRGRKAFLSTSNFSYLDLNGNGLYDLGEPIKGFPVGVKVQLGNGTLYIIASEQVFTNEVFEHNKWFLDRLVRNRTLILAQVEQLENPLEYVKYTRLRTGYNSIFLLAISFISVMVIYYVFAEKKST